jgi:hypothetical protein
MGILLHAAFRSLHAAFLSLSKTTSAAYNIDFKNTFKLCSGRV